MKTALAVLLALTPVSAFASEYQQGYSASRTCFKTEYREEYVPGNLDNPGYVKSWNETPVSYTHLTLPTKRIV